MLSCTVFFRFSLWQSFLYLGMCFFHIQSSMYSGFFFVTYVRLVYMRVVFFFRKFRFYVLLIRSAAARQQICIACLNFKSCSHIQGHRVSCDFMTSSLSSQVLAILQIEFWTECMRMRRLLHKNAASGMHTSPISTFLIRRFEICLNIVLPFLHLCVSKISDFCLRVFVLATSLISYLWAALATKMSTSHFKTMVDSASLNFIFF